jgi:hypothetical protein
MALFCSRGAIMPQQPCITKRDTGGAFPPVEPACGNLTPGTRSSLTSLMTSMHLRGRGWLSTAAPSAASGHPRVHEGDAPGADPVHLHDRLLLGEERVRFRGR